MAAARSVVALCCAAVAGSALPDAGAGGAGCRRGQLGEDEASCRATATRVDRVLLQTRQDRARTTLGLAEGLATGEWVRSTWTTGYWDCCKPSCSWANKGNVNRPARACDTSTGAALSDPSVQSACDGGTAASCTNYSPFVVNSGLAMGFTAAAVGGSHGLKGDENCGQCFELKFVDKVHPEGNWGGAHPELVGRSMVVQIINIGYDVSGEHSFDLQIPGAGQGAFNSGCTRQFPGYATGDFDCDNGYGGCFNKSGCARLPQALQAGCEWRYDWYQWFAAGGQTNNPYVDFRRVRCPARLTDISGSVPNDDTEYPAVNPDDYAPTLVPGPAPTPEAPSPATPPATTAGPPAPATTSSGGAPPVAAGPFCCTAATNQVDACGTCYPNAAAPAGSWCGESESNCRQCSGTWCAGPTSTPEPTTGTTLAPSSPPSPTTAPGSESTTAPAVSTTDSGATTMPEPPATLEPTLAPTMPPTLPAATAAPGTTSTTAPAANTTDAGAPLASTWVRGTWTTGYWDCCKPSCSWPNKGNVNRPARACDVGGAALSDPDAQSVCDGGAAASCPDYAPFVVKGSLAMGFTAAAVSGNHGLKGDENCGQCYELKFTDQAHPDGGWGGSHPDLVGRSMVVQVTNIGYDVTGDHSFDIQIPGAGQGAFTTGCSRQFPGHASGDFDCDNSYGGCPDQTGCGRLPEPLRAGCGWRYEWYRWLAGGGRTNNPYVDFRRVRCPAQLTDISGSVPNDDSQFPALDLDQYA